MTLPIAIVFPSSRKVKRPSCGTSEKSSIQTGCEHSMITLISAPFVTNFGFFFATCPDFLSICSNITYIYFLLLLLLLLFIIIYYISLIFYIFY